MINETQPIVDFSVDIEQKEDSVLIEVKEHRTGYETTVIPHDSSTSLNDYEAHINDLMKFCVKVSSTVDITALECIEELIEILIWNDIQDYVLNNSSTRPDPQYILNNNCSSKGAVEANITRNILLQDMNVLD